MSQFDQHKDQDQIKHRVFLINSPYVHSHRYELGMAKSGSGSRFGLPGSGPGCHFLFTGPAYNPDFLHAGPVRVQPGKIKDSGLCSGWVNNSGYVRVGSCLTRTTRNPIGLTRTRPEPDFAHPYSWTYLLILISSSMLSLHSHLSRSNCSKSALSLSLYLHLTSFSLLISPNPLSLVVPAAVATSSQPLLMFCLCHSRCCFVAAQPLLLRRPTIVALLALSLASICFI